MYVWSGDFSQALDYVKHGHKIARKGWNGKGLWVVLVKTEHLLNYPVVPIVNRLHPAYDYEMEPFFVIKNEQGTLNTWVPSVSDLMAEDWEVVE